MTRWITMVGSLVLVGGVGYCAVELYQLSQQDYQGIVTRQTAMAMQISDLNDRLVAATRTGKPAQGASDVAAADSESNDLSSQAARPNSQEQILPQHWLRQTVLLAQAQLSQGALNQPNQPASGFDAAKATLNQVKQSLNTLIADQTISAITATALGNAIDTDLRMIDASAQKQLQTQQNFDHSLAQAQAQLDRMARQGPTIRATSQPESTANGNNSNAASSTSNSNIPFWHRINQLFVVQQPARDVRENMLERGLICREVALTIGLARQALAQGQLDRVTQLLADSQTQLSGLVDADAKQESAALAALSSSISGTQLAKLRLTALQWLPAETALPAMAVPPPVTLPSTQSLGDASATTASSVAP